jgi:hypothetical protein
MIADGATVFLDRKVQIVHRRKLLRVVCIVDDYVVWRALDDPRALEVEYWVDGSPDIIQTVSRITTEVNKPLAVPVEGRPSATRKSQIGVVGINNRLRIYDCASGACEDPRGIYLPSRYAIREVCWHQQRLAC